MVVWLEVFRALNPTIILLLFSNKPFTVLFPVMISSLLAVGLTNFVWT